MYLCYHVIRYICMYMFTLLWSACAFRAVACFCHVSRVPVPMIPYLVQDILYVVVSVYKFLTGRKRGHGGCRVQRA